MEEKASEYQKKLKASEEKYRNLFENSPVGIYRSNSKGQLLVANKALAKIMGCSEVEELKNTYSDLGQDLYYDSNKRKEFLQIIAKNNKIENFIFQAVRKDGQVIFLKLNGQISKREGNFFEIDGFIEEITEKYQIQKRLAQNEEKFRSAFMNHSSPMLIIEPETLAVVEVNQSAINYYGYSYQDFLEMKVTDLNTLAEAAVKEKIKKVRKSQKSTFNFNHILKNGEIKNVEVHSGPIQIENKNYLFSIVHDITERKKSEQKIQKKKEELKTAEKMLNDILDLSLEAIRYVGLNYKIVKSNKLYKKLNRKFQAGRKSSENKLLNQEQMDAGTNCFDAFCTENCNSENCSLKLIKAGNEFVQKDVEVYLEGKRHHFIVTIVPYYSSKGKLKGFIQSYRDITERKESKNKLKAYYHEIKELYAKLDREFEKGIKLHRQFLPKKLPETNDLELEAYFQPADRLGGDFYNAIDIGDELLIYLADVSGHGLDGSMLNIFLRELVNNYLSDPKNVINGINPVDFLNFIIKRYHDEDISIEYMTCLLIGVYNKQENSFKFSNAGLHIPPIYLKQNGDLRKIKNRGVPISTAIDIESYLEEYQELKIELKPGEIILLTTDGIIEERNKEGNKKMAYGINRLGRVLKKNHELSTAEIIKKINQDFEDYCGTKIASDDITFLVLKIKD